MRVACSLVFCLGLGVLAAQAGDWPQFRGPGGTGIVSESNLPTEWNADKNVKWKIAIPGAAWSCPVVVGDKVFVTTAVTENQTKPKAGGGFGGRPGGGRPGGPGGPPGGGGRPGGFGGGRSAPNVAYQWHVMCLDRDNGKVIWDKTAIEAKPKNPTHSSNTYASETPVSDGERIYAYFGMTGLFCYDLAGNLVWKKDLGSYRMKDGWGTSSSPVIHAGRLFVQCDNEEKSFIAAFDAKTGDELWRESRNEKSGWSTPFVWKTKNRTDLVVSGSQRVRGYDPATGKVIWELSIGGGQCSASPVGDEERLYVGIGLGGGGMGMGGGFGGRSRGDDGEPEPSRGPRAGGLYAVKAGATGDISLKTGETKNAGIEWSLSKGGPPMASPLVYQGHLYVLERNGGMVSCYDAATGKAVYSRERIPNARAFWASPWAFDGNVFCLDEDGQTHVLKAGPKFEVITKNALGKDLYWATPAAAGGSLFVRGIDNLYCIGR